MGPRAALAVSWRPLQSVAGQSGARLAPRAPHMRHTRRPGRPCDQLITSFVPLRPPNGTAEAPGTLPRGAQSKPTSGRHLEFRRAASTPRRPQSAPEVSSDRRLASHSSARAAAPSDEEDDGDQDGVPSKLASAKQYRPLGMMDARRWPGGRDDERRHFSPARPLLLSARANLHPHTELASPIQRPTRTRLANPDGAPPKRAAAPVACPAGQ